VVPYYDANGKAHKLPTDFNEGEADNKMSRRQKMVGYSFSHQFDDTFTVRQNLRYANVNTLYRSVYGNGYIAPAKSAARMCAPMRTSIRLPLILSCSPNSLPARWIIPC
jgi:iron complex outermembrane receptor protein